MSLPEFLDMIVKKLLGKNYSIVAFITFCVSFIFD